MIINLRFCEKCKNNNMLPDCKRIISKISRNCQRKSSKNKKKTSKHVENGGVEDYRIVEEDTEEMGRLLDGR